MFGDGIYRIGNSPPFSIYSRENLIGILGCIFWFLAYGFVIYQSYRDKAYGIPLLAISLNFAWEFLASFVWENPIPLWRWLYRIWFVLDVVIVTQLLLYGRRWQTIPELVRYFYPVVASAVLLATVGQWAFTETFYDPLGFITAFMINLVMSIAFVFLYWARRGMEGLSYAAAWCKLLGTLCTSIECAVFLPIIHPPGTSFLFLHFLYVTILLVDCLYVTLLWRARRSRAVAS